MIREFQTEAPWSVQSIPSCHIDVENDVATKMRDGTVLRADIYKPAQPGSYPVLLMRTPYSKQMAQTMTLMHPSNLARYGYMVVVQDCRGTWNSDGDWYPFLHDGDDGVDSQRWVANLPESNGKIATYGFSYAGATQLLPLVKDSFKPTTLVPAMTSSQYFNEWIYKGGALQHQLSQIWALNFACDQALRGKNKKQLSQLSETRANLLQDMWKPPIEFIEQRLKDLTPYYSDWLNNETYNDYWKRWSISEHYHNFDLPALHIAGWYDVFLEGNIENFIGIKEHSKSDYARENQKLVIGPWYHMSWHRNTGMLDFGSGANNCVNELMLLWFDKYLKEKANQLDDEEPVAIFVMGENKWRFESEWPIKRRKEETLYLHSKGRANTAHGDGLLSAEKQEEEPADIYVYNPIKPIMSVGGRGCVDESFNLMGPFDQNRAHGFRNDVLIFKTAPLEEDKEVTGNVELELWAASSAPDTDFVARLIDIHPNRMALNVVEGVLRAKYRNSFEKVELLEKDQVYCFNIAVGSTSYLFKSGHSIGLEITSSSFPIYDRNSNSGKAQKDLAETDYQMATQTVFHDSRYPSKLILPVIPR